MICILIKVSKLKLFHCQDVEAERNEKMLSVISKEVFLSVQLKKKYYLMKSGLFPISYVRSKWMRMFRKHLAGFQIAAFLIKY